VLTRGAAAMDALFPDDNDFPDDNESRTLVSRSQVHQPQGLTPVDERALDQGLESGA
jgi:hypothetical protein